MIKKMYIYIIRILRMNVPDMSKMGDVTKNASENIKSKLEGTTPLQKVILVTIIIVAVYFVYVLFIKDDENKTIFKLISTKKPMSISKAKLPVTSSDYSICIWLFINSWEEGYGSEKNILSRFDDNMKNKASPSIVLGPHNNELIVKNGYLPASASASDATINECKVEGVPLQKWTCITVSYNSNIVDVYIDGKLHKTCMIPGNQIDSYSSDMKVGAYSNTETDSDKKINLSTFSGYLCDLRMFNRAINPREAYALYKQGNSAQGLNALLDKYKLKFALMENQKEVTTYLI